jgi:hypothetical protein
MRSSANLCCGRGVQYLTVAAVAMMVAARTATAGPITFSTFVTGSDILAVEGQQNTIAFNYAGNKFVGSVYFGANNAQLFSTNLNGGNVQKFGAPIPGAVGEVVVGASLGLGGFAKGDIFAGSQANTTIYHFSNDGSSQSVFATLPTGGDIRQIFFDPGNSFGGTMLVTTGAGDVYKVNSAGTPTLLASVGEDTEGMDIAPSNWGPFSGQLLVASEGSGSLRFISPTGTITNSGVSVAEAETVSFVPSNLGNSGNPLEGFYVANYPFDIQKADASQFAAFKGDAIVTSEFGSNAPLSHLFFDGTKVVLDPNNPVGNLPNQSEDGIFVTAQRIGDINPPAGVPEPSSIVLLLVGAVAAKAARRWRTKAAA